MKAHERKPGPYPYYGANGQQGTIDGFIFDEPLVLLAEDGGHFDEPWRGIAYRISGRSWVNNHAHVLRANGGLIPEFLECQLRTLDVRPYITGTTRGKLTQSDASRIPIFKPPITEQRRIVDVLDRAASIRRLRRQAQQTARQIIPALFVQTFGGPATNPLGWPVTSIEEIAEVGSGAGFPIKFQGDQNAEIPFYKVSDMNAPGNEFRMSTANHYVSRTVQKGLRAKLFPSGTVVFPKIGAAIATNKRES